MGTPTRRLILILIVIVSTVGITGCGSEATTAGAAGIGLGALFQNTLTGAKADLAAREQALIAAYNEGVTLGMRTEDLAKIEKELEWVRKGQAGAATGESLLGVDWNDPSQTGSAIANVIGLGLLVFGGKKYMQTTTKLQKTEAGINKFCGVSEPVTASQLHDIVKDKLMS